MDFFKHYLSTAEKKNNKILCFISYYKGTGARDSGLLHAVVRQAKKKKGDNQKGGDQNRYRPFTTSIT